MYVYINIYNNVYIIFNIYLCMYNFDNLSFISLEVLVLKGNIEDIVRVLLKFKL